MAWTVPMTFTAGAVLTASQLNTHLRDNLLETATAKATESGQLFISQGKYRLAARKPQIAVVETSETTTDTSFTDLTTYGPVVTVTTGTSAWVFIACESECTGTNSTRAIAYEISGATQRSAVEKSAIRQDGATSNNGMQFGQVDFLTDLTPGENVFSMKYKVGSGVTGTFRYRNLVVWPM